MVEDVKKSQHLNCHSDDIQDPFNGFHGKTCTYYWLAQWNDIGKS